MTHPKFSLHLTPVISDPSCECSDKFISFYSSESTASLETNRLWQKYYDKMKIVPTIISNITTLSS